MTPFSKLEHQRIRNVLLAAKVDAGSEDNRNLLERAAAWHKQWVDRTPGVSRDIWKDAGQTMANGTPAVHGIFQHAIRIGRLQNHTPWIDTYAADHEYLGDENGKAVFRHIRTKTYLP